MIRFSDERFRLAVRARPEGPGLLVAMPRRATKEAYASRSTHGGDGAISGNLTGDEQDDTGREWLSARDAVLSAFLFSFTFLLVAGLMWASPFVGSSDNASAAEVGRNLARGEGYTTKIVWLFVERTPQSYPHSQWPLSQPTLIALSMSLLGETAFAAKLVNAFWAGLLAASGFLLSRTLDVNRILSLAAALLLVSTPLLFWNSLYCMTHPGAVALMTILLLVALWVSRDADRPRTSMELWGAPLLLGLISGMLILQRPFYIFVLAPTWTLLALRTWRQRRGVSSRLPSVALLTLIYSLVVSLVVSPLVYRNWVEFDRVTLTPNAEALSINRLAGGWNQDVAYRVYWDTGLPPQSRTLLDWLRHAYMTGQKTMFGLADGRVVPIPLLVSGVLGLLVLACSQNPKRRLTAVFLGVSSVACYSVLTYAAFHQYYVVWVAPFLAAGTVVLVSRIADFLRSYGITRAWTGVFVLALVGFVAYPNLIGSWDAARASVSTPENHMSILAARFLDSNHAESGAVMTDRAWEVAFHADRPTVKLPNDTPKQIRLVADYYDVKYLALSGDTPSEERARVLSAWEAAPELVFYSKEGRGVVVYAVR